MSRAAWGEGAEAELQAVASAFARSRTQQTEERLQFTEVGDCAHCWVGFRSGPVCSLGCGDCIVLLLQ